LDSPSAKIEYKQGESIFRVTFAAKHQDFVPVLGDFRRGRSDEEGLTEAIRAIVPQYVAWLKFALTDFSGADAKFGQLTDPLRLARPEGESPQFYTEQSAGDAANRAGHLREALQHYLMALRGLPKYPLVEIDQPLREKIVKIVASIDPPPSIPEDAQRHAAYANIALQQAGGPSGGASDLDNCIDEWEEALRLAPWWAEAYYNLGLALEKRERYAEAARNLQFYLHAAPKAKDADTVQERIYELQYRAKQEHHSN
jgi:tetratricopeptide (TPR) repeat protein